MRNVPVFFVLMFCVSVIVLMSCSGRIEVQDDLKSEVKTVMETSVIPPSDGPVYDVKTFGAKGNDSAMDTVAIQKAIDACAATGGTVLFKNGIFLTSTIRVKSNMTLFIDSTAVIKGSPYSNDYPDLNPPTDNGQLRNCKKALIYIESADRVTIDGTGYIDGQNTRYDRSGEKEYMRPMAIFAVVSTNITLKNVKVRHSCTWSVVLMEVFDFLISKLDVQSENITRDGIDLVDCQRGVVEDCKVNSGDDGICLKSHSAVGLKDILIKNCTVQSYCNALKFGTPTHGPIENITFQDITIRNTRFAGIAVEAIDGSDEKNITFERINMDGVGTPFFILLGKRGYPAGLPNKVATIDGLYFRDISVVNTAASWGALITGTVINGVTYRPKNIEFTRVNVSFRGRATSVPGNPPEYAGQYPDCDMWGNLPAAGWWIRHAENVRMLDCSTSIASPDARKWIVLNDVTGFSNTSTGSSNPVTEIRAHKDVYWGNSVSIRGNTAPLSWSKGVLMTWTSGNIWVWKTNAWPHDAYREFKVLKNDSVWESGGNHPINGGLTVDIYPAGI